MALREGSRLTGTPGNQPREPCRDGSGRDEPCCKGSAFRNLWCALREYRSSTRLLRQATGGRTCFDDFVDRFGWRVVQPGELRSQSSRRRATTRRLGSTELVFGIRSRLKAGPSRLESRILALLASPRLLLDPAVCVDPRIAEVEHRLRPLAVDRDRNDAAGHRIALHPLRCSVNVSRTAARRSGPSRRSCTP